MVVIARIFKRYGLSSRSFNGYKNRRFINFIQRITILFIIIKVMKSAKSAAKSTK
ncbi:hypothetical protein PTET_a0588 [Pseudoalteromonas tetraodonis]|nr:hypothetical protein PTET_a0588 [Pseudoalteromonas tetraodonis]